MGRAHNHRINKLPESDENFVFTVAEAYTIASTECGRPLANALRIREWVRDQKCYGEHLNCGFSAFVIHFDETQGLLANGLSS